MTTARVRRKLAEDADSAAVHARAAAYVLEDQVGFLLRCAHQRASEIFNAVMGRFAVTPTGRASVLEMKAAATEVSRRTLRPLEPTEADALLRALARIG